MGPTGFVARGNSLSLAISRDRASVRRTDRASFGAVLETRKTPCQREAGLLAFFDCIPICIGNKRGLNSKQAKTLTAVFSDPASPSIEWSAIESLLQSVGCIVIEGTGSHVRVECRGVIASFHRPHPSEEAKRYQVRDVRAKLGVKP